MIDFLKEKTVFCTFTRPSDRVLVGKCSLCNAAHTITRGRLPDREWLVLKMRMAKNFRLLHQFCANPPTANDPANPTIRNAYDKAEDHNQNLITPEKTHR